MRNQFFFTNTQGDKQTRDSFNIEKVIRTVTLDDERVLVLLDDIHERSQNTPDIDPRTNKMKGMKRERNTYQTEVYLSKEDAERFYKVTNIETDGSQSN
jgi:hypothetical protein